MMIGRTAARRGSKTIWYVYADQAVEQRALREGLLEERAPDPRWRFVLAWGFRKKEEAKAALEELRPAVEEACEALELYLEVEPIPAGPSRSDRLTPAMMTTPPHQTRMI